jgi:hypothetical protein
MSPRQRIEKQGQRRYIRRENRGRSTSDQTDVGRSSASDQRRHMDATPQRREEDRGSGPPESWAARPVFLPRGWKAIHVERLWMHGEPHSLSAVAGTPSAIIDGARLRRAS